MVIPNNEPNPKSVVQRNPASLLFDGFPTKDAHPKQNVVLFSYQGHPASGTLSNSVVQSSD